MATDDPRGNAGIRAFVIHWDPATLPLLESQVRAAGGDVVGAESADGRRAHDEVRRLAPDVLVIGLAWKPSHGRVTAAAIRSTPWGRKLPILFVDDPAAPAPPATLQRIKAAVPDAIVDTPARLGFWFPRIAAIAQAKAVPAPANNPSPVVSVGNP
jgi:AmiR/NasT family two-component response regulator